MSPEKCQTLEITVLPWQQTELTAVLRARQLQTAESGERLIDEIVTDGAELIDAPMISRRQLQIHNGKVVTNEGEYVSEMWERGKQVSKKRAMRDSRFWLEHKRNCYEADEQAEFENEILPSALFNTLVTFSPYAKDQEKTFGVEFIDKHTHYKRDRKYGLARILYQTSPTTAEVVSISVENSDQLGAFHAVAESLGVNIPSDTSHTDMLGHRIKAFVPKGDRLYFERQLIKVFDNTLSVQLGGEYKQGRPKYKIGIEATSFVVANQDILAVYAHEIEKIVNTKELVGEDLLRAVRRIKRCYLSKLHERYQEQDKSLPVLVRTAEGIDYEATYQDMQASGRRLVQLGARLIGCGTSYDSLDELENMTEDEFKQLLKNKEEKYEFDKEMHCLLCQAPPGKDEKKKMCGPCGICRMCDRKLKSKMKVA